jgi:hypothetical protein
MNRKSQICTLNIWAGELPAVRTGNCPTRLRLTRAFSRVRNIQFLRNHRQDPLFEKFTEERIIWRELLELELQDVDEEMERIIEAAGTGSDS